MHKSKNIRKHFYKIFDYKQVVKSEDPPWITVYTVQKSVNICELQKSGLEKYVGFMQLFSHNLEIISVWQ